MTEAKTRIVLMTMVKNESRIIERLLNSVKGHVDGVVVCDTGSTDKTVELATAWLEANSMPGKVFEYPFKNFGVSRTQSFQCAQEWVVEIGWPAASTWALALDGDMMLSGPIDKVALSAVPTNIAGVSLKQANGSLVYSNMRLLRCSEPWICKGATHEAWTCPPSKHTTLFEQPVLTDHGDGGCKSDKYERDVRLLKEDLEAMPNDARTLFYLGQTYLCMRRWPEAVETFKKRIEVGGWEEETYIARVYLGECYENLKDRAHAIEVWMDAWQTRPHRTEAAIRLATMYRKESKSQMLAMAILEKLWSLQKGETLEGAPGAFAGPNRDLLFVNKRDMDMHFWEEYGILAYYHGNKKAAWLRMDEYDLNNPLGWHDFNAIFANMKWYDWTLKPRRHIRFSIPVEKLPWAGEENATAWQPFNPSVKLAPDGKSYWLNLRYANYWTEEAKYYHYRAFNGKVLTRNCFVKVPKENNWNDPASVEEIIIDPAIPKKADHYIQGIEDCRWIQNSDRLEFLGTSQSYSENGTNKIFHVTKEPGDKVWQLKKMALPPGAGETETQKNWMGFREGAGDLRYMYGYQPFRVCREDGSFAVFSSLTDAGEGSSIKLKEYRGSAGPVPFRSAAAPKERFLCVVHKVYIGGEGRRYYHRFMTLDEEYKPSRVSCFVRMTQERVEYWSGMCPSIEGDTYWIMYGLKDSEAYAAEMRTEEIEKLLFYSFQPGAVAAKPMRDRLVLLN